MKVERLSDREVREFLCEARALRNAYLRELLRDGARKLRSGLRGLWHAAHPAALVTSVPRRRSIDVDEFVVR